MEGVGTPIKFSTSPNVSCKGHSSLLYGMSKKTLGRSMVPADLEDSCKARACNCSQICTNIYIHICVRLMMILHDMEPSSGAL